MPNHSHNYQSFTYERKVAVKKDRSSNYISPGYLYYDSNTFPIYQNYNIFNNDNFINKCSTHNIGSGYVHNNMPPFLAAYCWRKTS